VAIQRLTVHAGPHDRENCPVRVSLKPEQADAGLLALRDATTGILLPCQTVPGAQPDEMELHFILPTLRAGAALTLVPEARPALCGDRVILTDVPGEKVDVSVDGEPFTSYVYAERFVRPFLLPIRGPFGDSVTRSYPVVPDLPGEKQDHPHHKSVWTAWGDVNGVDHWSEIKGHGWIAHRRFTRLDSGSACATLTAVNDWLTPDRGARQLEEERTVRFYALPAAGRAVDFTIRFRFTDGDVRFGDTKEGGILSVRVASSMDASGDGVIQNSFGGTNEGETWGKRAHWCDYYGPVNGKRVGIGIFDHPENVRYPVYWHVRNYGLMTANPFGLSHFRGDKKWDGTKTFAAGSELTFRYRLYIHADGTDKAGVAGKYHDFVNPPQVKVEG